MKASVVVLTRNGGERFLRVLGMLGAQEASFDHEVVVVDSGSSDGTAEAAERAGARVFRVPAAEFRFGPTRDLAFEKARGEIVVTISQDVLPLSSRWLEAMCAPFEEGADAVQMWAVLPPDEAFYWERIGLFYYTREARLWLERYGIGLSCHCLAVRRRVWDELRFGDSLMAEDKAFQRKLAERGCRIDVVPEALVEHHLAHGTVKIVKRCLNEGMGWRFAGVRYGLAGAVADLVKPGIWRRLAAGLVGGRVRRLSEVLYPLLRPVCLYAGNRFVRGYVR